MGFRGVEWEEVKPAGPIYQIPRKGVKTYRDPIAVTHCAADENVASLSAGGCILSDDDNQDQEAVTWYRQFQPSDDVDADGLSDGVELWHFGTVTQTVGSADSDGDRLSNADEIAAGTDPTNSASALIQLPPAADSAALVLSWPGATGRSYAIQSTAELANGFTNVVRAGIPADFPRNAATVDVSSLLGFAFYRVAVEAP